jgi:uncharacterized protein YbaR (Trm112 family)
MSQCPYCREQLVRVSVYHDAHEFYCADCGITVTIRELELDEIKQIENSLQSNEVEEDLLW